MSTCLWSGAAPKPKRRSELDWRLGAAPGAHRPSLPILYIEPAVPIANCFFVPAKFPAVIFSCLQKKKSSLGLRWRAMGLRVVAGFRPRVWSRVGVVRRQPALPFTALTLAALVLPRSERGGTAQAICLSSPSVGAGLPTMDAARWRRCCGPARLRRAAFPPPRRDSAAAKGWKWQKPTPDPRQPWVTVSARPGHPLPGERAG